MKIYAQTEETSKGDTHARDDGNQELQQRMRIKLTSVKDLSLVLKTITRSHLNDFDPTR
jgi:hypothetical protein